MDPHNTNRHPGEFVGVMTEDPRWWYYTLRRAGDSHPQIEDIIASTAARVHHKLPNSEIQDHETESI